LGGSLDVCVSLPRTPKALEAGTAASQRQNLPAAGPLLSDDAPLGKI